MIQRLGEQMGFNGERLIIALLAALLAGIVYAFIVDRVYRASPDNPYTFVFVLLGVAMTLAGALIVIPVQWVIILTLLFSATGIPQIIGSMIRDDQARRLQTRQLSDELRRQIEETLQ